jgi:hypothetical protein
MSAQQRRADPSWTEKLWPYAKIVVPIIVAIWIFNIASDARGTAQKNAAAIQRLRVPQFELVLVPGGPDRFASTFEKVMEEMESAEAFDATQFLWGTFVVRNTGNRDATDMVFDVTAAAPIDRLLITPEGYRNEATIEHEAGSNTASIKFRELDRGDEVLLFIGMTPEGFEQPYDDQTQRAWAKDFELYFEKVSVGSGNSGATLYSHGAMMVPLSAAAE